MINSKAPSPIRKVDYEAIETALLQSARGRWFLSEYTQRNRNADTRMLLDAISKLETAVLLPQQPTENAHLRTNLIEMAEAISQTRAEIAAMRSADQDDCQFSTATEELDAIVEATEKATSDILEAAEDIQELAWVLREKGSEDEACDRLDARATDIYTACSFQDVTGQRTSKVVNTLSFLENRVMAMIDIWGLEEIDVRDRSAEDERDDAHHLNGPARRGEGVDQAEVDEMISTSLADGPVIDSEAVMEGDLGQFDPIEPAPVQPTPTASEAEPAPATDTGVVMADEFTSPPELELDEMDEIKSQALFS
jgi:chemotaxis protein CheZ